MRRYFDQNDIFCLDLKKFELLCDLSDADIETIEKKINMTKLKKNSVVYHEGCNIGGIYLVVSGILKIYKTGYDGKEQIIRFAKSGDPIGYRSVIANEPACTSAETLTEASLCYIPGDEIHRLFKENKDFAMSLMLTMCKELAESNKFLLDLAQKTVRERLAEVLLLLMDAFDLDEEKRLRIALTREDLANMVGTATESVIRLLSEFKQDKIIELQGRYIKLLNVPQLIKLSNIRI
ncbi:MAG: Crp/Fnr family transcriptional regulator [Bacteroidales bacterium]|nr:Crp/Fnr family transcriptional regulator [Bacteroidales bacterium]